MAQDDYIRTALRVPPDLHKALHESAAASGKSFNAEILGRLTDSFVTASDTVPAELVDHLMQATKSLIDSRQYQKLLQEVLAGYTLNMFRLIPDNHPEKASLEIGRNLAQSLADKDLDGIEETLSDLLGYEEVSPEVENISRVLRAKLDREKAGLAFLTLQATARLADDPKDSVFSRRPRLAKLRKGSPDSK